MICLFTRQGKIAGAARAAVACLALTFTTAASAQAPQFGGAPNYYNQYAAPGYYNAGGYVMPAQVYTPGYCPCPTDGYGAPLAQPAPIDTGEGTESGTEVSPQPMPAETLPEVADVMGDGGYASAPQSAVPNAIGDSFGPVGILTINNAIDPILQIGVGPDGGRGFKATHNNSAVPRTRAFLNYRHFNNALGGQIDGGVQAIDVDRGELGYEYAYCNNLASIMLNVPFSHTMESTYVEADFQTLPLGMELGNVSVAFKAVAFQDCYHTISMGLGINIPTANDVIVENDEVGFWLQNETVVISPYAAWFMEHTPHIFSQGFVQMTMPLNDSRVRVDYFNSDEENPRRVRELQLLYIDYSVGAWLYRDCCTGNGIAAIGELHYTTALEKPEFIDIDGLGGENVAFRYSRCDIINATMGLTVFYNCWDANMAYVTPLTDDRAFESELLLQVNRRF